MKKLIICTIALTFLISLNAWSESLPEYTGNYIENNGNWLEVKIYKLNVMALWRQGREGADLMSYPGLFELPNVPCLKNRTPRILTYTGRIRSDPQTLALVKLEQLPYNNATVYKIDDTDYGDKIQYKKSHVTKQLWTFKREIPLRFKPIEGKTGMFVFQPKEKLPDGVYAIDSGTPSSRGGHTGLSTTPEPMFGKIILVQTAIPFIIGNKTAAIKPIPQTENSKETLIAIQTQLKKLNYYSGKVDGIPGPKTSSAIKSYQQDNNLTPDGIPSKELLAQLESKKETSNKPEQTAESKKTKESQTLEATVDKAVEGFFKAIFKKK